MTEVTQPVREPTGVVYGLAPLTKPSFGSRQKKGAAQHFAHYDQCSCRGGGPFFVRACHWELSEGEAACSSLPCLLARQLRRMSNEVLTTLATPPAAAEATLTSTRRALSRSVKRTKRS